MRSIAIQVQPERSPGIDLEGLSALLLQIAERPDLVLSHHFGTGDDQGPYFNFVFETKTPLPLWHALKLAVFESATCGKHMSAASMVMLSSEDGWDEYAQLYHWDPAVPVQDVV
jgi:hypothetical protein